MICFEMQNILRNLKDTDIVVDLSLDDSNFTFLNKRLRDLLDKSKKNIDNYIDLWGSVKKYTNHLL